MKTLLARGVVYWLAANILSAGPAIFPAPRHLELLTTDLVVGNGTPVLLPLHPSANDLSLARFTVTEFSDRFGIVLQTERVAALPRTGVFLLFGSVANPLVKQYLRGRRQPPGQREGYLLEVSARSAVVAGRDDDGAFYGLQSLRQLLESMGGDVRVRGAKISDWPLLPFRGVKLYLPGREHIAYFKRFVRNVLALYKYNKLILEMDGAMRLDRHPEINAGWLEFARNMKYTRRERSSGPRGEFQDSANSDVADGEVLEKGEVAELVQYVRQLHIDVIPEIPSLTHSYYLLARHRDLAEIQNAEWPDTYCPSNPRVYPLIFDVLDEYIDVMKPHMIHIGHDEWRAPWGVCKRCRGKDPTQLFAADVNRIDSFLRSRGIAAAMYGDHLMEPLRGKKLRYGKDSGQSYDMPGALSPSQVKMLIPKDILIFNWFWDGRSDEDLDARGIGEKNEVDLSLWGFRQVFGNFSPHIAGFDRRIARKGILGGVPSSWAATTELTTGKDMMLDVVGSANLLWSTDRPKSDKLAMTVQQLLPEIRNSLAAMPLPSSVASPTTISLIAGGPQQIEINADASSLIFIQACRKAGRNEPSFTATWDFADTAQLLGQYDIEYSDGSTIAIPIRYGVNILEEDWPANPEPKNLAYQARIEPRPGNKAAFAFEWVNPRPGIKVRSVRLRPVSKDNPVTLFGLQVVPKCSKGTAHL